MLIVTIDIDNMTKQNESAKLLGYSDKVYSSIFVSQCV